MPTKRSSSNSPVPQQPTGRLILSGLTAFGYHGNKPAERKLGQTFTVDLEVTIDTRKAAASDRIVHGWCIAELPRRCPASTTRHCCAGTSSCFCRAGQDKFEHGQIFHC